MAPTTASRRHDAEAQPHLARCHRIIPTSEEAMCHLHPHRPHEDDVAGKMQRSPATHHKRVRCLFAMQIVGTWPPVSTMMLLNMMTVASIRGGIAPALRGARR